jgi:PAS domain S-box-containing protein
MEIPSFDWSELLDTVHDDFMITDSTGLILYANAPTFNLYNMRREDLIGHTVEEMEQRKIFHPSITKLVLQTRKKETIIQETVIGTKVLVTGNPVFDEEGAIKYVISYSHDASELLRLQEYVNKMEEEMKQVRNELEQLRQQKHLEDQIIVSSEKMKQVLAYALKISDFNVTVLLTGESGVGKNVIARFIHQQSGRRSSPLVEINCASIPENLLESELFGYEGGSFSGAKQHGKKGLVEAAEGGTLFLDEIGELSLSLQAKLLALIQEKKFYPVGGTKAKQVDFRLIAATNMDLRKKVREGKFRQDLYFRLSVVPIQIPPLRERTEDLHAMIMEFNHRFNVGYKLEKRILPQVIERLQHYDWPGNVRELENLVERLILTVDGPFIGVEHLPEYIAGEIQLPVQPDKTLTEMLDEHEGMLIRQAYINHRSTTKLARFLGISQPTATRKLHKYKHLLKGMN